jgi:hypothetical protein
MSSRNSKNHQIEAVSGGCWGKVTKQRGIRSSYVTPNKNPAKKYLQNSTKKIPKKRLRKSQKRENGRDNKSLEEPRRIFYTYQERFIQGLACLPIIHPSLKISP